MAQCEISYCEKDAKTTAKRKSVCWMHQNRWKRHGSFELPATNCGTCNIKLPRQGRGSKRIYCSDQCYLFSKRGRRYNLTIHQYTQMVESLNGICPICRIKQDLELTEWHIDHDHSCCPGRKSCGKCIRGLICGDCNVGLGRFKDNPEALRRAADYLQGTL